MPLTGKIAVKRGPYVGFTFIIGLHIYACWFFSALLHVSLALLWPVKSM